MIRDVIEYAFTVHLTETSGLQCAMSIRPIGFYTPEMRWVHTQTDVLSVTAMSKTHSFAQLIDTHQLFKHFSKSNSLCACQCLMLSRRIIIHERLMAKSEQGTLPSDVQISRFTPVSILNPSTMQPYSGNVRLLPLFEGE